jgi:hypothetical protein
MRRVVSVDQLKYEKVDWGLTKNLVGPRSVESKKLKVNITEYLPGHVLDDSLFMHARWLAAGNQSELAVYPGSIHVLNPFPIKLAKEANDKILNFIAKAWSRSFNDDNTLNF